MTEASVIAARTRSVTGKANRRLAAEGTIPAVLYGPGRDTVSIALDRHEFELFLQHHEGSGGLIEITLDDAAKPITAMIKQVQTSPVKGNVLHVDFMVVRLDRPVQTTAPLHFVGESPGAHAGGILVHELREVTVEALPKNLPDFVAADITSLEVGDSLHVRDLVVPAGVTIVDDGDSIVCSVTAPTVVPTEEEIAAAAEQVEPEVIGESESE